ncbi:MAG: CHAT domain-containing protein [Williamsia sp.]|nr:CHAT domain-containing protein [Williamsia sp.]
MFDRSATGTPAQFSELKQYEHQLDNCPTRGDSTHALLLQRIGILYAKHCEYAKAIVYLHLSNRLMKDHPKKQNADPGLLIKNYYHLFRLYDSVGKPAESMAVLDSCMMVFNGLKHQRQKGNYINYVLRVIELKAAAFYDIGDYNKCSSYASMGEQYTPAYEGSRSDSMRYFITFLTWKVNALLATQQYAQAEVLLKNKAEACKTFDSYKSLGTIYDLLGQVQINNKNPLQARDYFMQSIASAWKYNDTIGCMQTYLNLGYYIYDKYYQDRRLALASYRKGLALFSGSSKGLQESNRMEALNLLANIANIYVQYKTYDSAFRYYQLAFDQISPQLQEKNVGDMPLDQVTKIEYLTGLLLDEADAYYKLYRERKNKAHIEKAISLYKITDKLLDRIKSEQQDVESKLFWRRDNHRLYEHAIEACDRVGGKLDEAFYFFEKSRATLLNDQLTEQQFLGSSAMFKQAQLQTKIFQLQQQLRRTDMNAAQYSRIQNDLIQFGDELDRLLQRNKSGNLPRFQSAFDAAAVTIRHVQQTILKDHKALVELFEGDSAVYIFTITKKDACLNKISKRDYDSTLNKYLAYISDPSFLNRNTSVYYSTARYLYGLLFPDKALPRGRIIISPDGRYFPFEPLITSSRKTPRYFLYDYAVSYTYSARYLLILNKYQREPEEGTQMLLGMAPVNYTYDTSLPPLQQSNGSVERVLAYFADADTLLFARATKKNFLKNFYKYRISYLSTHASDSGSMGEPVIYFADEPLSLSEFVAEKRPATQLVIASACKTGLGKLYRGEGVYNFSRGFASVGIPACVNNLWSVQEAAANRLTEIFCSYIAEGEPTDVALQKAKMKFIETSEGGQALPYYWAAAILSGTTDVIAPKKEHRWRMTVMLSLVALFTVAGLLGLRQFRKERGWKYPRN